MKYDTETTKFHWSQRNISPSVRLYAFMEMQFNDAIRNVNVTLRHGVGEELCVFVVLLQ